MMRKFLQNLTNLISFKNNLVFLILILLCLLVAFQYRSRFYWSYPPVGDTFDEFAYAWLGMSLVQTGVPTSWSFIPGYDKNTPQDAAMKLEGNTISIDGQKPKPIRLVRELELDGYKSHFPIVSPYLEQPPLGGIVISAPLIFSGVTNFEDASLKFLRKPFVFYGVLATLLVIVLAHIWYGRQTALAAGFLYATVPTVVLGSRLSLPENILVILILLELLLLELYLKKKNRTLLFFAYLITFFAPLVKPFGLAAALVGVGYFVLRKKDYKKALYFLVVGALSMATYILYGLGFDRETFSLVLSYQSQRFFAGPHIFLYKIIIPRITKLFLDGWIFLGWAALFILAFREKIKPHLGFLIAVFSYLLVVLFFGGEDFGWYRFPLYPFLMIAAGYLIVDVIRNFRPFAALLILGTGVASSFAWGMGIYDWSPYLLLFRIFVVSVVSVVFFKFTRVGQVVLLGLFIFSLFLNTRVINNISEIWPLLGDESSLIIGRE